MKQETGWLGTRAFLAAILMLGAFLPACAKDPLITAATKDDEVSSAGDPALQDVKKYNSDPNNGRTLRWDDNNVGVYDPVGIPNLQGILDDWNNALGGKLRLEIGGPGSGIELYRDDTLPSDICGTAQPSGMSGKIEKVRIAIRCATNRTASHEIGHALGFTGHADDGGVMTQRSRSETITETYIRTLRKLYDLKPGTKIT